MMSASAEELTVLAASSLTEVVTKAARLFEGQSGCQLHLVFASSGTLARQIEAGVPADVFLSANKQWVRHLESRGVLARQETAVIASNRLVIIQPSGSASGRLYEAPDHVLLNIDNGYLSLGDYHSVPAGMYAREALQHYGLFDKLRPRFVLGDNVRRTLLYVERGEVNAGIVYASDAAASEDVDVVFVFPAGSHSPIRYYATICKASTELQRARQFTAFLNSPAVQAVFTEHGFRGYAGDAKSVPVSQQGEGSHDNPF